MSARHLQQRIVWERFAGGLGMVCGRCRNLFGVVSKKVWDGVREELRRGLESGGGEGRSWEGMRDSVRRPEKVLEGCVLATFGKVWPGVVEVRNIVGGDLRQRVASVGSPLG